MSEKSAAQKANSVQEPPEDEGEILEWTCHMAARNWRVTAAVTAVIILFGVLVYYATEQSRTFTVLSLVILFLSLSRFYLPIRYRLSGKRIMVKTPTQTTYKNWSLYRSCYADKHGILLSPFIERSRLESFRGIRLLFSDNGAEVTEFVKKRIAEAQSEPSKGGNQP